MSNNISNSANNGAVLTIAQIIKNVMTSAADAEIRALYINLQQAISARTTVEEMVHKQPPIPTQTDNTTALGFVKKTTSQKQPSQRTCNTGSCGTIRIETDLDTTGDQAIIMTLTTIANIFVQLNTEKKGQDT